MHWLVGKRNLHLADSQATLALAAGRTACFVVRNAPFRTVKRAVLQGKTCIFATCCRPAGCAGCPGWRNVFTEKAACRIGPVGGSRLRHPACRLVASRPGKPFTEQAGHIHGNSFRPLRPAMCVNGKKRQPPRRGIPLRRLFYIVARWQSQPFQLHGEVAHYWGFPCNAHAPCHLLAAVVNVLKGGGNHVHVVVGVYAAWYCKA